MKKVSQRIIILASAIWLSCLSAAPVFATPLLALLEAENCGGCHNPGRSQRPVLDRRCTLDCQGCHADPAGGGMRNQWGYYYSQDQLAVTNFFKPIDPLKDTSYFDLHYDGRIIQRTAENESRTFPMSSEVSLRLRPFIKYVNFLYSGTLLGRVDDQNLRTVRSDNRRFYERYLAIIDNLPLNTYVKAGRSRPMYGLLRPNHSAWIRERVGLDQFALTDAVEVGGTPNVPFMRGSVMSGDPRVAQDHRQVGRSFHGGLRGVTLGWHVHSSYWDTTSKHHAINMRAVGAGIKPWRFIFTGERNWHTVKAISDQTVTGYTPHPSSVISEYTAAVSPIKGVMIGQVLEDLKDESVESKRKSTFIDIHPVPFLQFELWRRFESGSRDAADTVAIAHLYADF